MQIFTLCVGQGAFSIIRHQGEAIIVDSRIPPSDTTFAYVKRHLSVWLKDHYVRGLILTGFDVDHAHAVGIGLVLRKYRPDWVAYPDYDKDTAAYVEVDELITQEVQTRARTNSPLTRVPITVESLTSRPYTNWSSSFDFEVFSPHPEDMDNSNNCSLVVKVIGKGADGFSYLITGDTEIKRWKSINRIFKTRLRSDVMAAPHHGSKNATDAETLLLVSPDTILISAGASNAYGHPHDNVVAAYRAVARTVRGTHEDGGVSLLTRRIGSQFHTTPFVDN